MVRQDEIRRDEDEWMKGFINGRNGREGMVETRERKG